MDTTRQISVVVCTYTDRRWHELLAGVSALRTQTLKPHEILVVVDHEPRLLERVADELPGTVGLASAGPPGLAGSRNTGVRAATGSIVAFIDDDAVPEPDWLERLAAPYDDPDVAAVGGGIDPNWATARPTWFPPEFDWVVGCTYRGLPEARATVRNVIGANMSFRREVFEHLEFFHGLGHANGRSLGGEETDFCIRLAELLPGSTDRLRTERACTPPCAAGSRALLVLHGALLHRGRLEGRPCRARRKQDGTRVGEDVRTGNPRSCSARRHRGGEEQATGHRLGSRRIGRGCRGCGLWLRREPPAAVVGDVGAMKRPVGTGTLRALLVLSTACGLMLVSTADALSRSGRAHGSLLFWLGLIAILVPVTARLAPRRRLGTNESACSSCSGLRPTSSRSFGIRSGSCTRMSSCISTTHSRSSRRTTSSNRTRFSPRLPRTRGSSLRLPHCRR